VEGLKIRLGGQEVRVEGLGWKERGEGIEKEQSTGTCNTAHAKQHSTRNSVSGAERIHPQPLLVLYLHLNAMLLDCKNINAYILAARSVKTYPVHSKVCERSEQLGDKSVLNSFCSLHCGTVCLRTASPLGYATRWWLAKAASRQESKTKSSLRQYEFPYRIRGNC